MALLYTGVPILYISEFQLSLGILYCSSSVPQLSFSSVNWGLCSVANTVAGVPTKLIFF